MGNKRVQILCYMLVSWTSFNPQPYNTNPLLQQSMLDLLSPRTALFLYNIEQEEGGGSQFKPNLKWNNGIVKYLALVSTNCVNHCCCQLQTPKKYLDPEHIQQYLISSLRFTACTCTQTCKSDWTVCKLSWLLS